MYKNGGYAGDDRMCDLVCDRYAVLQVMSRFGIALGFGDKTIAEVCAESRVDAATFLAVVNMLMNFGNGAELAGEVSVRSLTDYLHNSHGYFLDFRLPAIRRKLIEAVDCALSDVSFAIMRFFDEYAAEVQRHMSYEEQTVFPYVESLLSGEKNTAYSIDIFRRQHDQIDIKLRELKNIIIKYYPSGSSNELNGVLFDIFNCEHELASHNAVEDELFIPAVERLAAAGPRTVKPEPLSAREKEIIVCVVKGMTNKQIADALCISAHTVITHRRNIAAKLQIHSAAGLTIYAIVNKLVELSEIKDTITDPQPCHTNTITTSARLRRSTRPSFWALRSTWLSSSSNSPSASPTARWACCPMPGTTFPTSPACCWPCWPSGWRRRRLRPATPMVTRKARC